MAFIDRLLPPPVGGGFAMEDYWVWGGSVIKGEDGNCHMFVSRWPRNLPFMAAYQTHSEVVRAESETPEGPYVFREVVLDDRGEEHWDGRMTHNPTVHKSGDTLLLFYIGSTYTGPKPDAEELWSGECPKPGESYPRIRIGLATSKSVFGPWERRDVPILLPRPGKWDSTVVTNPAPCVLEDGRILLLYRSNTPDGLRIGAAMAENFESPFERISDDPVLRLEGGDFVEDPCVWRVDDHYEMLAKDMTGGITGEFHAGVHARSTDGLNWKVFDAPKAYSRRVVWDDGTETLQGCLERPQLLVEDGRPTHLFAATGDGPGGFRKSTKTWNMVIPLKAL